MKISAVKAYAEVIPLPRPFHGSNYTYVSKKAVFLEVAKDEGISGFAYLGDDFSLGKEKLPNRGFLPGLSSTARTSRARSIYRKGLVSNSTPWPSRQFRAVHAAGQNDIREQQRPRH